MACCKRRYSKIKTNGKKSFRELGRDRTRSMIEKEEFGEDIALTKFAKKTGEDFRNKIYWEYKEGILFCP
ncbi:MAG: hypothetical protein ACYC0D_11905 [Candidatus Humimicrobiaceae bacterium]